MAKKCVLYIHINPILSSFMVTSFYIKPWQFDSQKIRRALQSHSKESLVTILKCMTFNLYLHLLTNCIVLWVFTTFVLCSLFGRFCLFFNYTHACVICHVYCIPLHGSLCFLILFNLSLPHYSLLCNSKRCWEQSHPLGEWTMLFVSSRCYQVK